jgi:cytochrome c biogenesis protein CcmG, thiol:disulfide interchange protein DsbE
MKTTIAAVLIACSLSFAADTLQAPDFSLSDLSGVTVTLSSFKGRVVVIDFWATWCTTCKEGFKGLNSLQNKFKDQGVSVIGIDLEKVNPKKVDAFVKKAGITYTILLDPKTATAKQFGIKGVPSLVIINQEQKIVKIFRGLNKGTEKEIDELVTKLAAGN